MAAAAQLDLQESVVRRVLNSISLPEGIQLYRVRFQNDSTGEPAIYAVYSFTMAGKSDEELVKDLSSVRSQTFDVIRDLGSSVIGYTEFIPA